MSNTLDDLSPLNFLAVIVDAEERRKEGGLPADALVMQCLWLCTRKDLREAAIERAKRWAFENFGTVELACLEMGRLPEFASWRDNEEKQRSARDEERAERHTGGNPPEKTRALATDAEVEGLFRLYR